MKWWGTCLKPWKKKYNFKGHFITFEKKVHIKKITKSDIDFWLRKVFRGHCKLFNQRHSVGESAKSRKCQGEKMYPRPVILNKQISTGRSKCSAVIWYLSMGCLYKQFYRKNKLCSFCTILICLVNMYAGVTKSSFFS